jgi:hypothetical protein
MMSFLQVCLSEHKTKKSGSTADTSEHHDHDDNEATAWEIVRTIATVLMALCFIYIAYNWSQRGNSNASQPVSGNNYAIDNYDRTAAAKVGNRFAVA